MHHLANLTRRLAILIAAAGIPAVFGAVGAAAQSSYPERTIRIVTITAAGTPADILARLIGDRLAVVFGKPVIVESMVGAGGNAAVGYVAKAAPDGHTLVMSGDAALVTNISLYEKLPYNPVNDLAPITQVAATPNILTVHNDVPAKSVSELVALARAEPGKLTFGHGGFGFSTHLSGEVLKAMAQVDIQQVPYRGVPAVPDLLGGRVTMCFCNISSVLSLIREGKLRGLAVTSPQRTQAMPDLPTLSESGFPGFDVTSWFALLAPAGTPAPIIEKLHGEAIRALALPEVREKLAAFGMEPIGNSPAELAALIKAQIPERAKVIKASGVKLQ